MFVVEKDGARMTLNSDVQLAAFVNSGWALIDPVGGDDPRIPDTDGTGGPTLDELKAEAVALGVEFRDNIGFDKLLERVQAAKVTR